jgi:type IV secretory pathway VirB2 component (pilin)
LGLAVHTRQVQQIVGIAIAFGAAFFFALLAWAGQHRS